MTEIVTVSATTAAYATEPLKASARVSGSAPSQEAIAAQVQEAQRADTLRHQDMTTVVGPAALALFFLNAGQQNRFLQQATLSQIEDAYFGNGQEEIDEDEHKDESADEHSSDSSEQGDDPETLPDDEYVTAPTIMALPAPSQTA